MRTAINLPYTLSVFTGLYTRYLPLNVDDICRERESSSAEDIITEFSIAFMFVELRCSS